MDSGIVSVGTALPIPSYLAGDEISVRKVKVYKLTI